MEHTIELIKQHGSTEAQEKVEKILIDCNNLETNLMLLKIVFAYKGRRMKLTGSFACVNQIMGTRFKLEK